MHMCMYARLFGDIPYSNFDSFESIKGLDIESLQIDEDDDIPTLLCTTVILRGSVSREKEGEKNQRLWRWISMSKQNQR